MSDFFKWLGDWLPFILWCVVWASVFPMRFVLLALLPPNSKEWHHPMNSLFQFLAFER